MRQLIAALFLVFALAMPAKAADTCEAFRPQLKAATEHGWVATELDGDQRARFVANYNAIPPKSDVHPDSVWVLRDSNWNQPVVTIVFVIGDCVEHFESDVSVVLFEKTLTDVPGDPA